MISNKFILFRFIKLTALTARLPHYANSSLTSSLLDTLGEGSGRGYSCQALPLPLPDKLLSFFDHPEVLEGLPLRLQVKAMEPAPRL